MDAVMKVSTCENIPPSLLYTLILSKCISLNQIQLQKCHTESSFPNLVELFSYSISSYIYRYRISKPNRVVLEMTFVFSYMIFLFL